MARAMHRGLDLFPWLLLILLVSSTLWRCDDEGNGPADSTDTGGGDAQGDATGDSAQDPSADPSADTVDEPATDAVTDGNDVEEPQCFDGARPVGDRCASPRDRACLDSGDCRPTERCDLDGEDEEGTCMYLPPPPITCPGGPRCFAGDEGPLRAGFASRSITPEGWEEPRAEFMDGHNFIGDPLDPETFFDCGRDMICPDDEDYDAPDEDGSEDNGHMEGIWIAGLDESLPALRCPPELLGEGCTAGLACCANERAHDDILAVGGIFEQGDSKVAIVTVDVIGYFYSEIQRIRARLPVELDLDLLIVSATHVHEAPDSMGLWGPGAGQSDLPAESGIDPATMTRIQDQIIALLEEANDNLTEVDLYATQMHTGVELVASGDGRDPWIIDDTLALLHVVEAGGNRTDPEDTVGVIANWGSHPESIGDENSHISADFPHYVRSYIADGLPAVTGANPLPALPGLGGPVLYISRAVGGLIGPLHSPATTRDGTVVNEDGFAKADAIGQQIASMALTALAAAPGVSGDLSFGQMEFMVGVPNLRFHIAIFSLGLFGDREIYNWRFADGFTPENPPNLLTAVARVQIGPLSFATVPGEIFPETVAGGFRAGDSDADPVRGDPRNALCGQDLLPVEGGAGSSPCLIDPNNPNPPDLDEAPTSGFLADELPGDVQFIIGLGMDEIGYLVPAYDFELDEGAPYVAEPPGDHYEETNSVGGPMLRTILDQVELLWGIDGLFAGP